jgi:hypothetical protein
MTRAVQYLVVVSEAADSQQSAASADRCTSTGTLVLLYVLKKLLITVLHWYSTSTGISTSTSTTTS